MVACVSLITSIFGNMQHVDSNREIRAMILCALPYPPLPVSVRRFDEDNKLGDEAVCTSHDLISQLLEVACIRSTAEENSERQKRQRDILRAFVFDLVKDGPLHPPALFEVYCRRTHEHIGTYFSGGHLLPEVRFMPFNFVCRGDKYHAKICEYMAAQAILLELQGGKATQDWMMADFPTLLSVSRDRIVSEGELRKQIEEGKEPDPGADSDSD